MRPAARHGDTMSSFRIATWNIRKCIGLDRRRDPGRVLRVIAGLQADIVVLQEADRRLPPRPAALPPDLIARETGLTPVAVADTPSLGHHGNAILHGPALAVSKVEPLDLPGLEPRGALVVDIRRGSAEVSLAAVHLGLTRGFRLKQLEAVAARLQVRPSRHALIAGDFNEWSPVRALTPLAEGYEVHSPGPTFHSARPIAPLDRIAVTPGLRVRRVEVVQTPDTRMASDHLPVVAEIEVEA